MPANPVASITNPRGDRFLTFWVDEQQRLALSQTPVDPEDEDIPYNDNNTPNGSHVTNQTIAAVYVGGLPCVYGKVALADKSLVLAQLSPIINVVPGKAKDVKATKTDLSALAAVSNGKNDVWFYYLKKPSAAAPAVLTETHMTFDKLSTMNVPGLTPGLGPDELTSLAALYIDETHRDVFFQKSSSGNQIYCLPVGSHTEPVHIAGTDQAMANTPMAVTRTKSGAVYLYYLAATSCSIQRATRIGTEWSNTVGTMSKFASIKALSETQLAVTHSDRDGKLQNILSFIYEGESEYKTNVDTGGIV